MTDGLETRVVRAVADAKDTDPMDLDCSLHEYIDFEALRQLDGREDTSWTISFELPDHEVTVTSDGTVWVDKRRPPLRA